MPKKIYWLFSILLVLSLLLGGCASPVIPAPTEATEAPAAETGGRLILATTTSTNDSGLLDYILPDFEAETGASVEVIAVGTGQALTLGENGDADVLLVHARAREDASVHRGPNDPFSRTSPKGAEGSTSPSFSVRRNTAWRSSRCRKSSA